MDKRIMKKLLVLMLALAMIGSIITGCATTPTTTAKATTAVTTVATTAAPAASVVNKVYLLDNGYFMMDPNNKVGGTVVASRANPTPVLYLEKTPSYSVLIDTAEGYVLFDTGFDPDGMKETNWTPAITANDHFATEDQRMENQLKKIGVKPEDVKKVVLSHMHYDHIGNAGLFTNADFYINKLDYDEAVAATKTASSSAYIKSEIDAIKPAKVKTFTEEFYVVPGVKVLSLPGHTAGFSGIMVITKAGNGMIFPSDAAYTKGVYESGYKLVWWIYDSLSARKSLYKLKTLATANKATVFVSHDMEEFKTFKLAPAYYE